MSPLLDLTLPRPGSDTAHQVFSASLRGTIAELRRFLHARSRTAPAPWRSLRDDVERLRRERPASLAAIARDVGVAVWLRCMRRPPALDPAIAERGLAASLGLALAHAGALSRSVEVGGTGSRATSVVARASVRAAPTTRVSIRPDGGRDPAPEDDVGFHPIAGSNVMLATADGNPLWAREEHPDKQGNRVDLGARPVSEWTDALGEALDLIAEFEPDLRREIELGLQLLVPVGFDPDRHLSASYAEAIGQAYVSLHPSALTMAEAIIHEFSHNKISAALEGGPMLDNPWDEHPSPVRPDDRPLHGVLLAAHAFVPVARLCARIRDAEHRLATAASEHLRRYIPSNLEAIGTLEAHGRWTERGRPLFEELHAWAEAHADVQP